MNMFARKVQSTQLEKAQRTPDSVQSSSELNRLPVVMLERFDKAKIMSRMNDITDINYATSYGLAALHLALGCKDEDIVLELLRRGANPNINEQCSMLSFDVADKLLKQAVNEIRRNGYSTPLVFEMWMPEVSDGTLKHYMTRCNDASEVDAKWRAPSALRFAVDLACPKLVKLLLDHGARLDEANGECSIVLVHTALTNSDDETACLLIERGEKLHSRDNEDEWGLQLALQFGCYKAAEILLDRAFRRETSELERRKIAACLLKNISENDEPIIRCLATFDLGIQHEFLEETNTAFIESYYRQCVEELNDMKEVVLYGNLTLYKLLARNGISQVSLMRNQVLIDKLIEICGNSDKYPIYNRMLVKHLNEIKTVKKCYLYVEKILAEEFDRLPIDHALPITVILDSMSKDEISEMHFRFTVCMQNKLMKE